MSAPLLSRSPHPRTTRAAPRYPRTLGVGTLAAAALLLGCAQAEDGRPTGATGRASATPSAGGSADAPHFSEDDAPLTEGSCQGQCPDPFEASVRAKDESQLRARVLYCMTEPGGAPPPSTGKVLLVVGIGPSGKGEIIALEGRGQLTESQESCVRKLVASASFTASRTADEHRAAQVGSR